jgi:hypothetical protein
VSAFGRSDEMSMPASAIAATTDGLTSFAGVLPAERTRTSPSAYRSRNAAAI